MIPPGGWHYVDGDATLKGYTYKNLLDVVRDYRAENNLPAGDVEGDVNSYICTNWPNFCHGVDMVVVTSIQSPTPTTELLNDIQQWAKNLSQANHPIQYVTDELAEERAKICRGCEYNVNWRGGCNSCIIATDRICASVRQARDTASSAVLGGCHLMRHDNRSAIFLDRDELQKSSNLPANCWMNI